MRRTDWGIVMERTEFVSQRLANRIKRYTGVVLPTDNNCFFIMDPIVSQYDHKIVVTGNVMDSDFKKKSFEFMFSIPQHRNRDNTEIVDIYEKKFREEVKVRLPACLASTFE